MTLITAFGMSSLRPQEVTLRSVGGAILDGGASTYLSSFSPNPVFFHDLKTMVLSVLGKAGKQKISRLKIHDHGNAQGCALGADWVTDKNFENYAEHLAKLSPSMNPNGWVHLTHCEVGRNEDLLRMFALIFGVPVYAATGKVNGFDQIQDGGSWTRCSPSGMIYHKAFLPAESDYKFTK